MPTRDGAQLAERAVVRACTSGLEVPALQREVLGTLRRLIPVDAAFFATADPETLLFTGAAAEEPLDRATPEFMANEFGGKDVNAFAVLAGSRVPISSLDTATRSDRWASPRYRDIMRPLGLGDELRAALVAGRDCWGYLCLHREDAERGFAATEVAALARLVPHIAQGLRSAVLIAGAGERHHFERPGVVVLTDELDVVAVTPEAEGLLALLPGAEHGLPITVPAVARALVVAERDGATSRPPMARVPTLRGGWLLVSASRLRGPADERRISVVLCPAQPADTVPLLLSAHGLTDREAEVARLVLRGTSTRGIVGALHISSYTVQDHLKSVFDKVGVRSRGDLAVRLLGR
ncbi:MAG TPA: helix-turn-helix transcriptional regulator [Blastococcus sp.]|nr:helix-turn-helix transcriptional regulator [Blastococcus sp.]